MPTYRVNLERTLRVFEVASVIIKADTACEAQDVAYDLVTNWENAGEVLMDWGVESLVEVSK
jgi:hypothetical protein